MKKFKKFIVSSFVASVFLAFGAMGSEIHQARAEDITFLEENYKTSNITASKCYSYYHVANGGGSTHGLVPGEKWGDPINAANGNVIYKIDANDGKAFASLSLDLTFMARRDLQMKDGSRTTEAGINVYYSLSPDNFGEYIQSYAGWNSDSSFKSFTLDLTTYADGESSIYVKVELCHNEGQVYLSSTGTKLESVKFYGSGKESDISYVAKSDSYVSTQSSGCVFDSFNNLGGFANSNGLVPTSKWGGEVEIAENAYVIYSLSTPVGPTFRTINVSFSGRAWSGGTGTYNGQSVTTAGCCIKLYISSDVSNFGSPVKTFDAVSSGSTANFNYSDNTLCLNNSDMYIKIELVHPAMKCSLSQVGTRLYSASISGSYLKTELINSIPMNETIILGDEYQNYEKTGILTPYTSDGRTHIYAGGDKASIIIPINCNPLYKYYNLTFTQFIRCTTYNGAEEIKNALTYSVSLDGENYTDVLSLDTDTNWTRKSAVINLSNYVRGYHNAFVKASINWSGKAHSHDWISISDIALTGDLVERDVFDIFYENMYDAVNSINNPSTYNYGESITLDAPTRANYSFDGWYLDEDYQTPFTGITSETKGDIHVYAKWSAVYIPVILNALDGEFADHMTTYEAQGHYDTPLSREGLPTPSKEGCDFVNWYKDSSLTHPFNFLEDYGESDLITESINLYAKYGNLAKVTYVYNNGVNSDISFYQEVNEKANTVNDPIYEGYKFGGWYLGNELYDFNTLLTGNITLTARWYFIYTITYTGLDDATHSNPTTYTEDINNITLTDATRTGYTFKGWYLDGAKVTEIDTKSGKDLTLEARWEAISYNLNIVCDEHCSINSAPTTITYVGTTLQIDVEEGYRIKRVTANNNAVPVNNDRTIYVGGYASDVTINVETTSSYYFHGSIDIEFKNEVDISKYVADCNNVANYTGDKNSSKYGWLVPEDYSRPGYITYAIDAGEGQTINSLALTGRARVFSYQGSQAILDLYVSLDGKNFELINSYASTTDGEAITDINVNLTSKAKGQQIIYIKYVIASGNYDWVCLDSVRASMSFTCVTITFMDKDTVMYTNSDQIKGAPITLLENPTKPGYTFLGWYADSSFRRKVDSSFIASEDMNIYAKWEANTYSITYVVGEDADIGDNVESYTIEEEVELSEANKKNHKFVGWYDNPNFTGEKIEKINKGTYGDLTLYAKFEEGIEITYVLNGGENNELNPEVYFIDEETMLFDPYREGYVFGGWYLDSDFTELVDCINGGDGEPITLYAMWIKDGDDTQTKKGCGGSIIASSSIMFILSSLGLALVLKKKKDE